MTKLTQDLVNRLFDYQNGELYWKVDRPSSIKVGDKAGFLRKDGYYQVKIDGKPYLLHRIIYLMFHGYLPKEIDHIDDMSNNCIANLRDTTHIQNTWNNRKQKSYRDKPTSSIYKGVSYDRKSKCWRSYITKNGKRQHLGFSSLEKEAALKYNNAAIALFGSYARLNII